MSILTEKTPGEAAARQPVLAASSSSSTMRAPQLRGGAASRPGSSSSQPRTLLRTVSGVSGTGKSRNGSRASTPKQSGQTASATEGLMSWLRDTLVPVPIDRFLERGAEGEPGRQAEPGRLNGAEPVSRGATPLMPGALRTFDSSADDGRATSELNQEDVEAARESIRQRGSTPRPRARRASDSDSARGASSNGQAWADDNGDSSSSGESDEENGEDAASEPVKLVRPMARRKPLELNGDLQVPAGESASRSAHKANADDDEGVSRSDGSREYHGREVKASKELGSDQNPPSRAQDATTNAMDSTDTGYSTALSRRQSEAVISREHTDDEADETPKIKAVETTRRPSRRFGIFGSRKSRQKPTVPPTKEEEGDVSKGSSHGFWHTSHHSAPRRSNSSKQDEKAELSSRRSSEGHNGTVTWDVIEKQDVASAEGEQRIEVGEGSHDKARKASNTFLGSHGLPRDTRVRHKDMSSRECDFTRLFLTQEIDLLGNSPAHSSGPLNATQGTQTVTEKANTADARRATRVMRFSLDGKHLAVGGQDGVIRVFAVLDTQHKREQTAVPTPPSSTNSTPTVGPHRVVKSPQSTPTMGPHRVMKSPSSDGHGTVPSRSTTTLTMHEGKQPLPVFSPEPLREFRGHTSEVLDLNWSKGGFLLSASMDKTARVWHLDFENSLATFEHGDFVTSAVFHPRDDRFFLSGSLDGRLRLWNIASKKLHHVQDVPGLITACAFTASGRTACAGLFSGAALFFSTDGLKAVSSVALKSRKSGKGGRKITGIEPIAHPAGTKDDSERVLITSNDSCIRAYEIGSKRVVARFKSKVYSNRESQIRASLSDDVHYIVAGSETGASSGGSDHGHIVLWNCASTLAPPSAGRWLFSKISQMRSGQAAEENDSGKDKGKSLLKPRDAKSAESAVEYFTAHDGTVSAAVMAPLRTATALFAAGDPMLVDTRAKVLAEHEEAAESKAAPADANTRGRRLSAAITAPMLGLPPTNKAVDANAALAEACKRARIIVSVDDSAILRIWRSDGGGVVA